MLCWTGQITIKWLSDTTLWDNSKMWLSIPKLSCPFQFFTLLENYAINPIFFRWLYYSHSCMVQFTGRVFYDATSLDCYCVLGTMNEYWSHDIIAMTIHLFLHWLQSTRKRQHFANFSHSYVSDTVLLVITKFRRLILRCLFKQSYPTKCKAPVCSEYNWLKEV